MTVRAALSSVFLLFACTVAAYGTVVTVVTENYPPYNYLNEDGMIAGEATGLVHKVMRASGLAYEIKLLPWPRAVRNTLAGDSTLIFSIARSPTRESDFTWLVPLAEDTYHLFGRTDDTRRITAADVRSGKYRVVCIFEDISCPLVRNFGIPDDHILEGIDISRADAMKLVQTGRVDFYVAGTVNHRSNIERLGFHANTFGPRLSLETGMTLYLAAGKKVRPEIQAAVVQGFEKLLDRGEYRLLFKGDKPANSAN